MKKILNRKEKERIQKRNNAVIGSILVVIMFLSVIGYSFFTRDNGGSLRESKITYNGVEFQLDENGFWKFEIFGKEFSALYSPEEVLESTKNLSDTEIQINKDYLDFQNKLFYVHFENDFSSQSEIIRFVGEITQRINQFCFQEDEILGGEEVKECEWPIKNCSAENSVLLIVNESVKNSITQQENCIFIEFKEQESLKTAYLFLYRILGIL